MNVRKFAGCWLAIAMLWGAPLTGQEPPAPRWEESMLAFERQDKKSPRAAGQRLRRQFQHPDVEAAGRVSGA